MPAIYKPKTLSSYPFARLCDFTLWRATSCASNVHLELRNILSFSCSHNHTEIPYCKTDGSSLWQMFYIRPSLEGGATRVWCNETRWN